MEKNGIFNTASSFSKFWNTKVLWEWTNESRFDGVYSRSNLPKKTNFWAYIINLDEYADVGTHWIALYCKRNEIVYFNGFGVEHVLKRLKNLSGIKTSKLTLFEYKQTIQ